MKGFRTSIAAAIGRVIAPLRPTPGTTEGAVLIGMLLLAVGLVLADLVPLAFIIPGAILVLLGSMPALRRTS